MQGVVDASVAGAAAASLPVGRTVLFSAVKDEAPFLLEWIAYHKVIGFDEIVICSNPSGDGTEELLAALAEAGEIRHLRTVVPPGQRPQGAAALAFRKQVGHREGDWYLWLDADEFLNVHVGDRTVDALIASLAGKDCALINWRVFGSGGNARFPGRFIAPEFSGAAAPGFRNHLEQKAIFRASRAVVGFAHKGIHRPLVSRPTIWTHDDVVVGAGSRLSEDTIVNRRWLEGANNGRTSKVLPSEFGWALAQINHYIVRTPEFFALKRLRGRGAYPNPEGGSNRRHTPAFFAQNDRNEEEDRSILFWQDRVTVEIDRLLRVPDVAEAKAASDRLVAEILASQTAIPVALSVDPNPATVADQPTPSVSAVTERPRRVLFSAMKNEAPFILEWVAYHKAIGFDDIVICSNPSNDGTEDVLAALASVGEITHLRADPLPGEPPQGLAARVFSGTRGYQDGTWYLWLDADEFLNVHVGQRTVDDLVKAVGGHDCLFINWRIFGSNGNASFPGRVLDPAFCRASAMGFEANAGLKSFFRMSGKFIGFATVGIHRPLVSKDGGLTGDDVVTGSGRHLSAEFQRHRNWLSGASYAPNWTVDAPEVGWGLAQINHYMVRTPEFFALKKARGRGWQADSVGDLNLRHTAGFFQVHDRNEEEDRSILVWQDRVTSEIARLTADPGIAAAVTRSAKLVAGLLAKTAPIQLPAPDVFSTAPEATPALSFKLTFPPAETRHVSEAYARASMILEYGSGGSTVLAAELGKPVMSVESDKAWAERLSAHLAPISGLARVHHVDIGPTEKWGMPSRPRFHGRFHAYPLSVWDRPDIGEPDLVLIDGRFRAACLAAVVMRARAPTTVLIDDYIDRPHYHDVEALARKDGMIGRMARFTVTPGPIPPEMLTKVIGWFSDPR